MTIRTEVPPIRIPIEITIEDEEFAKVQKTIGKRKKSREETAYDNFVKQLKRNEKEQIQNEKKSKKQQDTKDRKEQKNLELAERLLNKRVDKWARPEEIAAEKRATFGKAAIMQIGNIGHPLGIATSLIGRIVPLAVPLVIISATESIIKALTQKGSIFDLTFRNTVDDRINVLRSRESQQEIRVGFEAKSQLIVTTRAGTTSPISSYNTYEQRNNNTLEFEKMRAVREVVGT